MEITERTDSISTTQATTVLRPAALSSNIDFLSLSQINIMIENDFDTTFGSSFELQAISSSQTETALNDLPDNDGIDDFIKTLNIPILAEAQTFINIPTSRSIIKARKNHVVDNGQIKRQQNYQLIIYYMYKLFVLKFAIYHRQNVSYFH